jgi:hypothetical protein
MESLSAEEVEVATGGWRRLEACPVTLRPDPGLMPRLPPGTPTPVDREPGVPPQ